MKSLRSLLAALLTVILVCTLSMSAFAVYNDIDAADEDLTKIEFVDKLGILPSTWKGDFNPDGYFTRADAVVSVYRMLYGADIDASLYDSEDLEFLIDDAEEGKGDIKEGSVLAAYLTWAVDNYLITTNVTNSVFKPQEPITANEFMTLIAKVLRLVDSDATYPDDYTTAVSDIVGKIEAGDTPVTRRQAAVALANALVTNESGEVGTIGVYTDYDGEPISSLAVKVFNMSSVDLVIRATKNNPLGYNVENGVLLSNGADVDLGDDLSDYVGYGINLTYCDTDSSKTYTEDEEILAYSLNSTNSVTVSAMDVTITSGNSITANLESGSFVIGSSTYLYLNGEPWPIGDEQYDLVKLIPAVGHSAVITNRPNLTFKCMQIGESTTFATVFANETKPGKILGINNGYYSVYDYYSQDPENAIKTYYVSDCKFSSTVKVGDYVNFYESSGVCHMTPGNTIISAITSREVSPDTPTDYILANMRVIKEHEFFRYGNTPLIIKADGSGPEYVFILADAEEGYMLTWENIQTNFAPLEITGITSAGSVHSITAKNLRTTDTVSFDVSFDNTDSATPLKVGDFIDYSDNGLSEGDRVTYVKKTESKTITATDMGDYFMDTATGKFYYKNQNYKGSGSFTSGKVTLNLDMAQTVVSITLN